MQFIADKLRIMIVIDQMILQLVRVSMSHAYGFTNIVCSVVSTVWSEQIKCQLFSDGQQYTAYDGTDISLCVCVCVCACMRVCVCVCVCVYN